MNGSVTARTVLPPDLPAHSIHAYFVASPESPDGCQVLCFRSADAAGERGDVVVVDRASGATRALAAGVETEDAHRAACQQWICGGDVVVFHEHAGGGWNVVAVELSGGGRRVLATGRQLGFSQGPLDVVPVYGPHWDAAACRDLELLDARSGQVRAVLTAAEVCRRCPDEVRSLLGSLDVSLFFPCLSPDGQRLFFKLARPHGGTFRSPGASARAGLFVYDLVAGEIVHHQARWGHPCWLPDSRHILDTPNVLLDVETGRRRPIPGLPRFRGSHPSPDPRGTRFVTDAEARTDDAPPSWNVVLADLAGHRQRTIHECGADAGAGSWRVPHPHPAFSPDGQRVYFNANDGPWTRLTVVGVGPRGRA